MKQSDAELVKYSLEGHGSAFGELVQRYQAAVYGYAYHLLSSFDEAEEICQEVFIQAYANLANLKEAEKFPGWLRGITRNLCHSFMKQKEKLRSFEGAVPQKEIPTPEDHYEKREFTSQLMTAVNTLSERNRLLLTLFYLNGLSYKEIGDFLEIPLNTIKVTLRRAREQLKENLLRLVEEGFKENKLSSGFVEKVSKAIEERKNITLLAVKVQSVDRETLTNILQEGIQRYVRFAQPRTGAFAGSRRGVLATSVGESHFLLFGIPTMAEDDAERAILCAIFLKQKLKEIGAMMFNAGINTGLAEIHQKIAAEKIHYVPLGNVLTFTLELMELADGQILTSESIYRLTQGRFIFRKIDREEGEPSVYEVLGIPEHPRRIWGGHALTSEMIGRDGELAKLKRAIEELKSGRGRIISVIGEAGIGKSRLVCELKAYLKRQEDKEEQQSEIRNVPTLERGLGGFPKSEFLWLEGRCVSYGKQINYLPFREILGTYFDIKRTDDDGTATEKMTAKICALGDDVEILLYLAGFLSVEMESEEMMNLTAEQLRYKTFVSLRSLLRKATEIQPLVIAIEDMHWMDDASYDLFSFLLESVTKVPILFLCLYRPEQDEHCFQIRQEATTKYADYYDEIALFGLSSEQSRILVAKITNAAVLPPKIEERIISKAGGNPLFLFEMFRALVDSEQLVQLEDRWQFRGDLETPEIPDAIHSVIMSRIDRLEMETKQTLLCASVIGDVFDQRLLKSVCGDMDFEYHLNQLNNHDFIYSQKSTSAYRFKHALIRDVAMTSLLEENKREYHQKLGEAIESIYPDSLDEYYELLAHHYKNSGDSQKAFTYLQKAGDKSKGLYANEDALRYYTDALDAIENLTANTDDFKLIIYESRGDVLALIGKYDEAIADYNTALELSEDGKKRADLYRKIGALYENKHDVKLSLKFLQLAEAELNEDKGSREMARAYMSLARTIVYQGSAAKAVELLHKSLEILRSEGLSSEMAGAITGLGLAYARKGDLEKAVKFAQRGLKMTLKMGDANRIAWTHRTVGNILLITGDLEGAIAHFHKSPELFEKTGDNYGMALHYWVLGGVYNIKGDLEAAIDNYRKSIEWDRDLKFAYPTVMNFLNLSGLYGRLGDLDNAFDCIKRALDIGLYQGKLPLDFLSDWLSDALNIIEKACDMSGSRNEFISFCNRLTAECGAELQSIKLTRLYSQPQKLESSFTAMVFGDDFDQAELDSEWTWVNPRGDCSYNLKAQHSWLEITAASGCNLTDYGNLNAPRLVREIDGDFAVETKMKAIGEDIPIVGGLLVWKGDDGLIRLERNERGRISFSCKTEEVWRYVGSRYLSSDVVYLRLERLNESFSAYCSGNGNEWMLCEEMKIPINDPLQVGLYAIGAIVRTAIGVVDAKTGAMYDYFKVFRRNNKGLD